MLFLEKLILTQNHFSAFPLSVLNLSKLRHLVLDNNRLFELPEEINLAKSLRTLSLANNQTVILPPDTLGCLTGSTVQLTAINFPQAATFRWTSTQSGSFASDSTQSSVFIKNVNQP